MAKRDISLFKAHTPSTDDIARASKLAPTACPRRYCWWWQSLAFEWETECSAGCQVAARWPWPWPEELPQPIRCRRATLNDADRDLYESRGPHLIEDGFEENHFSQDRVE